jgi:hypothetical protein
MNYNNIEYYNIKKINYTDLNIQKLNNEPIIFISDDLIEQANFEKILENYNFDYSITDNVKTIKGNIKIKNLDNKNKYIFHNFKNNIELINKIIEFPDLKQLRILNIYKGFKNSGCNIHCHSPALNYLINGKKLWLMFPNNLNNINFLKKNNFVYGKINERAKIWFEKNYNLLKNNIIGLKIFIQNKKNVVYIPNNYFHMIINLENVIGVVYSWIDNK